MESSWSSGVHKFDFHRLSDGFLENSEFLDVIKGGSSSSSSLVLDSKKGEPVKAPIRLPQKEVTPEKAMVALKKHCEAEKRRRGRINGHLATLRNLIPIANKMDKASVLAEAISHLKELKRNAAEASKDLLIPMDIDEVKVEQEEDGSEGVPYHIRASLCCDYKPEVLFDLSKMLDALQVKTVRTEIATLEGRMKNVFVVTGCKEGSLEDTETLQLLAKSVYEALRTVLDKFSPSQEY